MNDTAQYEITRRDDTEATVKVTIPPDELQRGLDSVYRRYGREARIPGFRKGHVPRHLLESRFGKELFVAEAKEDLQRLHVAEALTSLALRPVSTPRVEEISEGGAEPLVFEVSFAVLPEVELPALNEIEITVPPTQMVTDADVQQALGEVQSHFSTLAPKEGDTVGEGDIVRVKQGDQEWDTRAEADHPVTRNLMGAKVDSEVEIDEELPDGKRLQTTLAIAGLQQIVLPEIDDELAKDAGFDDLDALKRDIETKLTDNRVEQRRRRIDGMLLEAVVDKTEIPLPDPFLDELVEEELQQVKSSFDAPDEDAAFAEYLDQRDMTEEAFRGEIRAAIARRVRQELVMRAIARSLEIEIDDEELTEIAQAEAEERGEEPLRFVAQLKASDRWDGYRTSKVNQRVFDRLREVATVREEEAS